jgi:tRNA A-37 threonylcarbamoyl transferase component Bud32
VLGPDDLTQIFAQPADTSEATGAYTPTPDDPNRTGPHHAADPTGEGREAVPGYEVLGERGRGGMGVVYRARQVGLNRTVALKMVLGGGRADRQELIRFLAEAEVAASVAHPNVVRVFDYGESHGRPFMALEFVSGGSLNQKLKASGPLPPNEAAELVRRIADGVAAAHDRGVVHRDLKPGNVLLDGAGEPKVADFGLAKRTAGDDLTRTGAVMGTPSYMAPEQAKGDSKFVGPQADVGALGVILYECLTGRVPFAGGSSHEVLRRVIEDTPAPPSRSGRIPRDLETICLKCLEKAPAERYETAAGLAADLSRFLAGEPILARPAGRVERAYKWARRKPWQAAARAAGTRAAGLVPLAVVMAALYQQAEAERRRAEAAMANEETERKRAQDAEAGEKVGRGAAEKARAGEKVANERLERKTYAATVNNALLDAEAGVFDRARNLLATCPEEHRGREWHYVHRDCHLGRISHRYQPSIRQPEGGVILGLIPDGTTYVVHSVGKKPALHDVPTGKLIRETEYAPRKATTSIFWQPLSLDAQTGQLVIDPKPRDRFKASSQGGQRAVTAYKGDTLQVTDRPSKAARLVPGNVGGITAVAISQDGKTAAVSCGDTAVRAWDLDARKSTAVLRGRAKAPLYVGLTPDGRTVVTTSTDGTSHVWDVTSVAGPRVIAGQMFEYRPGGDSLLTLNPDFGPIRSIDWVPGTNRILATAGLIVQRSEAVGLLWDAAPINQSVKPLLPLHQAPPQPVSNGGPSGRQARWLDPARTGRPVGWRRAKAAPTRDRRQRSIPSGDCKRPS